MSQSDESKIYEMQGWNSLPNLYLFSWLHLLPGEDHLPERDSSFRYHSPTAILTKWEAQCRGTAEGTLEPYSHCKPVCQTTYSEDNENIQATHEILSRDEATMRLLEYWDPKTTLGSKLHLELRLNGFWRSSIHLEGQPAEVRVLSQDWNGDTSWRRHQIRLLCPPFRTTEIVDGSQKKLKAYSRSLFSIWTNRPDYRPVTNTVEGRCLQMHMVLSWYCRDTLTKGNGNLISYRQNDSPRGNYSFSLFAKRWNFSELEKLQISSDCNNHLGKQKGQVLQIEALVKGYPNSRRCIVGEFERAHLSSTLPFRVPLTSPTFHLTSRVNHRRHLEGLWCHRNSSILVSLLSLGRWDPSDHHKTYCSIQASRLWSLESQTQML